MKPILTKFENQKELKEVNIKESRERSVFCVTVYASQASTVLSGSRNKLLRQACLLAHSWSWLLLEQVGEMHHFHTGTAYQSSNSISSLPVKITPIEKLSETCFGWASSISGWHSGSHIQ